MKLLSPTQLNDGKAAQTTREIFRIKELDAASDKARKNLANAEADFNATLAKNRTQWAIEEEDHAKRLLAMKDEIDKLEAKRLNALIPIGIIKKGAEDRMEEATIFLAQLRQREEHAEDLRELLEDKLDKVGQFEQDLIIKDQQLESKRLGLIEQANLVTEGIQQLNQETLEFGLTRTKAEANIHERKTSLALLEATLVAKQDTQRRTGKALEALATRLADERIILQKAWDERHRKYPNIPLPKKP